MSERDRHKATYYSGKKPYLTHNYRTMMKKKTQEEYYFHELNVDPMSELLRPYIHDPELPGFTGYEYMEPPWGFIIPGTPGWGWGPAPGECGMACNDSMLDCEGGCTTVPCICASGGLSAAIAWDEGGKGYIGGTTPVSVIVCTGDVSGSASGEYPSMGVHIVDGAGFAQVVRVALVDCVGDECCDFIVTGADTVNAGSQWTGTVSPSCPGATCSVVSNSGCALSCSISPAGSQVTVTPGGGDCGSFIVTVTDNAAGCSGSASKNVRINGGGASWQSIHACPPSASCSDLNCATNTGAEQNISQCIDSATGFKWGGGPICQFNTISLVCRGCTETGCPAAANEYPTCINKQNCLERDFELNCDPGDGREHCSKWGCNKCEWKCAC